MTGAAFKATSPNPVPDLTLYRMSSDHYERIVEAGLLGSKDKVVLLDGLLVKQMTKGSRHRNAVLRGLALLRAAIPVGWDVWPEQPISLPDGPNGDSVPEPDLAVVFGNLERYEDRNPVGSEIGMVVEVASSAEAMRIDREAIARYAHASIPIACVVNILDRSIEIYSDPSGPTIDPHYRKLETSHAGQILSVEIGQPATGPAAIAPIPVEAFFAPKEPG